MVPTKRGRQTADAGPSPGPIHDEVFFDHAGVMLVVLGSDERIEAINRKACEVLECDRAEVIGGNWFDLFIPAVHRDRVREAFRQLMRDELEPVEYFENRIVTGGGAERVIHWHNTVIRDPSGAIQFSLSSGEDITERRQRQQEIIESRERFRALFERAGDGMLVADAQSQRFVAANPAICRLLGYDRDELLELQVGDIHPPGMLPEVEAAFAKQLGGELDVAANLQVKRKDGTTAWVDISSTALTLDGRPCLLGIFRDVTDRRLVEAKLLQTQKLESLGVLAGGLAHDLNNILVGILGHADLAGRCPPGDEALGAHLGSIRGAATQAGELCQRLLEYAGKSKPRLERVDLNALVSDARTLLEVPTSRRAALTIDTASSPLWVACVPTQIRQILVNLVTNAAEATKDGGAAIVVTTRPEVGSPELTATWLSAEPAPVGPCALLEVTDQGSGMDAETCRRIFDPFFSTKAEGRGLGLSAVVGIIGRHGGALTVESQPGGGTTVRILLPVEHDERAASQAAAPARSRGGQAGLILLVDDEPTVRQVVQLMLESHGYEVACAASGAEAVAALPGAARPPKAALLDLTLADGGGVAAARNLRQIIPGISVLFMSGYPEESLDLPGTALGNVAFLQKPFTAEKLIHRLEALLANSPR